MKYRVLTGNALKIIAAISMLADHIGLIFFPFNGLWRIFGRLALPIFAFMIAESAKYTRNRKRHFFTMFGLAVICQIVYFIFDHSLYMCVLVTFSLSILMLFALDYAKKTLFADGTSATRKILSVALFVSAVAVTYLLNLIFDIDYGFWGCMVPVFAGLFRLPTPTENRTLRLLDTIPARVLLMGVGLIPLSFAIGWLQPYSLLTLPILFLYSGKRGKRKMKYFFYIFYPLHLALLEGIYMLLYHL